MSKPEKSKSTEKEKVIVNVADSPILEELDAAGLIKAYHRLHVKQKDAEEQAHDYETDKKKIGKSIQEAMTETKADILVYENTKKWQATLVKSEPSTKLNEDKLRENLMKTAKLSAETVKLLFDASQDTVPARASWVLVTVEE